MSINNDVFTVIVSTGNAALIAAGNPISALAVNQMGFFDAKTNLSITTPAREFFIAIGKDTTGGAVVNEIKTSAGQKIQKENIRALSFREHSASQPMIVKVADYAADCDSDYTIRVEFRNQEIYRRQGYNQFTKAYSVRTACCEDCATCPSGDANEITSLLIAEIAIQEDGLLTTNPIARQDMTIATHGVAADYSAGDVILVADLAVMIAFNAVQTDDTLKVYSDIELTSTELAIKAFCAINVAYFKPRQTKLIISLVDGFGCSGAVSTTQDLAYEEGNGYDVQQKEYHAGGWDNNPGPYRVNVSTGLARAINYDAVVSEQYDQFALTYDQFSVAGWGENLNNLATLVAIPATSTVTRDSFATILDAITSGLGFDPLADDAAAADVDPAVVVPTTDIDDVTLDGDA
jgi:hypothetical protein